VHRDELEERAKSADIRPLKIVWPFLRPYRQQLLLALLFLVVAAATTLVLPYAVRQMIDLGFSPENSAIIDRYFWGLFGVVLVMELAVGLRFYFVSWLGERVVADIRDAVYRNVIDQSPTFFETTRTGEVLSRINTDTTLVQTVVGSSASVALRSAVMLLGSMVLLVITSAELASYMLLVIPVVILPIVVLGRWVRRLSRESQDRIADFSAIASETISAVQTVQAFTQSEREKVRFGESVARAFATAHRRIGSRVVMSVLVGLLIFGAIIFVLWMGAKAVIAGDITGGLLSQFILYSVIAAGAAGALTEVWGDVQRAAGAMERIAELLNCEPEIRAPEAPVELARVGGGSLAFEQVRFCYPGRPDAAVFEDLSFRVSPGETVALVGPSGAGKTTIFQLLMRFYDPQQGRVLLNSVPIRDCDPEAVRGRFALVPQDTVIFSGNARDNIAYGRPDADENTILEAARVAHAHEFIRELPDGYDTYLGERGVRLSGGQKQRISIARAVLKNPQILLLDEATSSLDAESERLVQEALDELQKTRTTLVIAHRLATVRQADRILLIDQGRLVAEGDHDSLLGRSELYSRLASLQFAA
jgi:ATP-binding cassette subfamily B protein